MKYARVPTILEKEVWAFSRKEDGGGGEEDRYLH